MILNESLNQFKNIIKEEYNVTDERRANWMAKLAQVHSVYEQKKGINFVNEGIQNTGNQVSGGIYTTPLNTMGMGGVLAPQGFANAGTSIETPANIRLGSGDVPMSTLTASLEIAAVTIGFDLVPVVQATGPWAFLSFNDYPYAGGKLGRINETSFDGKGEGGTGGDLYLAVLEGADTNLGTLGVQHDGGGLAQTLADTAEGLNDLAVGLVISVGKIQTCHIHACLEHFGHDLFGAGGRADGADDLGF